MTKKKAPPKEKAPAKKVVAKKVNSKPRPQSLPGMEDRKISALENKAFDYAYVRDNRIALSVQEVALKKDLLDLMKKEKRDHYKRNGISIDIVHEKENIKVKVKTAGDDDEFSYVPSQAEIEAAENLEEENAMNGEFSPEGEEGELAGLEE